ncbi:MAG: sodium/proton-translocating pyrophosphatase [Vicinamibacterales bacterium]
MKRLVSRLVLLATFVGVLALAPQVTFAAQPETAAAGTHPLITVVKPRSSCRILSSVNFLGGVDGHTLLMSGLVVAALGLLFGLMTFNTLKNLPVHSSMREVSELIYETCKTYLTTQGRFIMVLWVFIAVIITAYYGWLNPIEGKSVVTTLPIILIFSLIGIAGSYGVAWFGIRVNTFANSRAAFASLKGKPFPIYAIPLQGRHEHRHAADQRRAARSC